MSAHPPCPVVLVVFEAGNAVAKHRHLPGRARAGRVSKQQEGHLARMMDIFMQDVSLSLDTQSNRGLRVSCGSDGPGLEPVAEESAARLSVDVAALEKEVAPAAAPPLGAVAVGPLGGRGRGPQTSEGSPRALVKSSSVKLIGPTHTRLSGQRKTLDSAEAAELKRLKSVRFSTCSDSDTDDCGAADLLASGGSKKSLGRRSLTLEAGETWQKLSQFTGLKEIYRGRVSLVAAGTCKSSGRAVVLKAYIKSKLTKSLQEMVYREVRLHGRCNGIPGVVGLLGWWEDDAQIVLIQEHCEGGDLYRELVLNGGQMSEAAAVQEILCPLMLVLSAVHRQGLAHRDLKPENLFFSTRGTGERQLRVGDFGLASDLKEMRDRVGTLDYMAPEVITQKDENSFRVVDGDVTVAGEAQVPSCKGYTSKVDVWALGAIAYELLVGKPPFEVADPQKTAMLIVWGQVRLPETLSSGAQAFIRAALTKDPELRPDVDTLLGSAWITSLRVPSNAAGTWLTQRSSCPSVPHLQPSMLSAKSADLSGLQQLDLLTAGPGGKRKLPPAKSKSTRVLSRNRSPPVEARPMPSETRKSAAPRRGRGSYDSVVGDSDSEPGSFKSFRKPVPRQRRRSSRFSADSANSDEEGNKSRGSGSYGGRLPGASNLRRASDASTEGPQASALRSTNSGGTASRSSSGSSLPLLRRLSSFLGLGGCMSPKAMGEDGGAAAELPSAAPTTPRVKREPPRPSPSEASASVTTSVGKVRSSRGFSDGSGCSVVTSTSERSVAKQRRPITRAASRIGLGVSRLVSKFFDDAPWNTGGAALRSFASLVRPEDEELERMQTESANVVRNRFMEYMMRREGDNAELSRADDLGKLEGGGGGGGGGAEGRPSEGRRRAAPRPSATFTHLRYVPVPVETSQPAMTLTTRPAVLAELETLSLRGRKVKPA